VMIAYASVYGNTENASEILACRLRDKGVRTVMYDVSVTPASNIVSEAFRWSHLVFASTTYNAGIFVTMEAVINDLVAHNIQNRTVAVIENGSWAATSGGLIREELGRCRNINILKNTVSLVSGLKPNQLADIASLADAIADSLPEPEKIRIGLSGPGPGAGLAGTGRIETASMFKLSYGLFVITSRDGEKDNGCITNTVIQVTESPLRILVAVNKANYTHGMIYKTRAFNVSILDTSVPFSVFQHFGFQSGRDVDKFANGGDAPRTVNGVRYVTDSVNAVLSAKVTESLDYGTHTVFIADVVEAFTLPGGPSVTYQYYFDNIKPKPQKPKGDLKGYVCRICGYTYEGEQLPEDFICPLCKHGADDFEKLG